MNHLANTLIGTWTYRSFHHVEGMPSDPGELHFGFGQLNIESYEPNLGTIKGYFLFGASLKYAVQGTVIPDSPFTFLLEGIGEPGTPTEEWAYVYRAYLTPDWPTGVDQRPAFTGSVMRLKERGGGSVPAGVVRPFIATKND